MKLTIIIPTYKREHVLCNTINSVLQNIEDSSLSENEVELLIIDQTSEHISEVADFLREISKRNNVHYILELMPNLPNARNVGIQQSSGDIILFLDDDVDLYNGFLDCLINCYDNSIISSVVGGVTLVNQSDGNILLQNNNWLKKIIRTFFFKTIGHGRAFSISSLGFILSETDSQHEGWVDAGRGCNMSFRRVVFDKVNLFDTSYRGNALREETDLFCRMKKAGLRVWYCPSMRVNHIMSNTGGCRYEQSVQYWYTYFFNQCYFYLKNFHFSLFRVRLILAFDLLKCHHNNIKISNLVDNAYHEAKALLKNR